MQKSLDLPLKYVDETVKFEQEHGSTKKHIPIPFHCTIDKMEESGCLSCEIWFCVPNILINHMLPFRLTITDALRAKIKARIHNPVRFDTKHYVTLSCDRLGKDYWPIQDEYQKHLNVDPSHYRDVNYIKAEAKKLIDYIGVKFIEKIYFNDM